MKGSMRFLTILLAVVPAAMAFAAEAAAPAAPPTRADIERLVAAIADYDLGKPREPIAEVERLVLATHGQPALRQHLEAQFIRVLEGRATGEARLFICEQLWRIGSAASVPVLGKMLLDEKTAHMACWGLVNNPSAKAPAALREALGRAKGKALLAVIGALGDRRDTVSVETLGQLAIGEDAAVAEAAAAALGRISGAEAAAALAKTRTAGDARRRAVATEAYLQCADRLAAAGKEKEAAAIFRELLAPNESRLIRRGALVGLLGFGGPDAVALVISTLSGDDAMLKATAIANVRTLKGQGIAERFAAELPKLPADLQVLLIGALADREDPAIRPAVASAAKSDNAGVRVAALKALAKVGDASSVALLASAMDAADGGERLVAAVSLYVVRGDGVDAAIVESMKSAKPAAKAQPNQILSDRGAAVAAPAILKEAAGQAPAVRAAALKALGRLAGAKDLLVLLDILVGLQGDDGRDEAESAVVAVSRKLADEAGRAEPALAALRKGGSAAAKGSLLRVLRGLGGAKALDAVRGALKDADPPVQDAAVRALADWPDPAAVAALMDVLRTTTNDTQRVVALRGCVRLLGLAGAAPTPETVTAYEEIMGRAKRPEEKKLVLAGLASLSHPAALAMAESCLADEAVTAEAALAVANVARAIMGTYREEVKAAMTRLAATAGNTDLKWQAAEILRQIDLMGDYVAAWQFCGPYAESGKKYLEIFDIVFPPEKPDAKDVQWRLLPADANPAGGPVVFDLLKAVGGEERVAYVRTWIRSQKAQDARLEIGVDDGIKVWLNGKVVVAENRGGACIPGSIKADVTLREGWNPLIMKVTQSTGPWAFCMRLAKRDGGRLEGVSADGTPK